MKKTLKTIGVVILVIVSISLIMGLLPRVLGSYYNYREAQYNEALDKDFDLLLNTEDKQNLKILNSLFIQEASKNEIRTALHFAKSRAYACPQIEKYDFSELQNRELSLEKITEKNKSYVDQFEKADKELMSRILGIVEKKYALKKQKQNIFSSLIKVVEKILPNFQNYEEHVESCKTLEEILSTNDFEKKITNVTKGAAGLSNDLEKAYKEK